MEHENNGILQEYSEKFVEHYLGSEYIIQTIDTTEEDIKSHISDGAAELSFEGGTFESVNSRDEEIIARNLSNVEATGFDINGFENFYLFVGRFSKDELYATGVTTELTDGDTAAYWTEMEINEDLYTMVSDPERILEPAQSSHLSL